VSDEIQAATWVFLIAASLIGALLWWLVKGE
jgi:hypothetical protein